MANTKKYKDRYVTTLPFEKEDYKRLDELLPRGITIADEINTFIKERVKELEKEKNRDASITLDASPIRLGYNYDDNNNSETLDKYITFSEDKSERVKDLWNKDSIDLYELSDKLVVIQTEISTIRWKRHKQPIPKIPIDLKLIPFIEESIYGDLK